MRGLAGRTGMPPHLRPRWGRSLAEPRGARALLLVALLSAGCTGSLGDDKDKAAASGGASETAGGSPGGADATGGTALGSAGKASGGGGSRAGAGGATATSGGSQTNASGGSSATPTTPTAFGTCPTGDPEPGVTPLMKLSTVQYRNTVRDLLAASGLSAVADGLTTLLAAVPDDSTVAFRGLDPRISTDHVAAYFQIAVAVGDAATSSDARLTALAGACATTSPLTTACLDGFLQNFARRALRRPLDSQELGEFRDVAQGSSPKAANAAEALRNVVVTLLLSPRFVNHLELAGTPLGGRQDYLALDPYETASRLSYTFWQTLPDDELLASAADGSLASDAGFEEQLDRVFSDARTQQTLWQFWNEWLRFESFTGFASERPAFQALAKGEQVGVAGHNHWADMVQEIRDLTDLYTWKQKGTFAELMTSTVSVTRSADLARLYGVSAWSGSGAYPTFPSGNRAGLLQRGALLASSLEQTNPFHRGSLLRRAILCDGLPRPDPNSLPPGSLDTPPPSSALTTRQRFAKKVEGNALCETCHASFSNLGYVMEAYDALGRFRTMESVFDEQTGKLVATLPIDTSAVPQVVAGDLRPVSGPAELNDRILESGKVEACLSANYFRYALRRDPSRDSADACAYEAMRSELDQPGVGLRDVFRRIASESIFRRKKVGSP